jgi:hypothetical protein
MAKRPAIKDSRSATEWPDKTLIAAKLELMKSIRPPNKAESNWAEEIRTVRLELRKLLDKYPQAFAVVMNQMASGEDWDQLLPPRSSERVAKEDLAQLLADYRNARDLGWSRLDYFKKVAEDRWPWGGRSCLYGGYHSGIWNTPDAVEAQLKKAERLVKKDEGFAQDVDYWQHCMRLKYLGAVLWGRKNG